jgi:hypothetical protein
MSRIIIFGLDGKSMGELHANCNRGWVINDSGQTTVTLPTDAAASEWLEFGRMALVEHPKLPAWAGMIDTPWTATPPVKLTLYNAGYLLHIRTFENPQNYKGNTAQLCAQMVAYASNREDLGIQMGDTDVNGVQTIHFNATAIWEQMVDLVNKAGMEMQLRAGRDANNKLAIWLDVKKMLGINTSFLLHDGANHNLEITSALVDGEIWNRLRGMSSSGSGSDGISNPREDPESIKRYRLRTQDLQYPNVTDLKQLANNAAVTLAKSAYPYLNLTVNILDVGDTFSFLDLGNQFVVHASKLWLPGGVQGWRGAARLTAMAYDEENNKIAATLIGTL